MKTRGPTDRAEHRWASPPPKATRAEGQQVDTCQLSLPDTTRTALPRVAGWGQRHLSRGPQRASPRPSRPGPQ